MPILVFLAKIANVLKKAKLLPTIFDFNSFSIYLALVFVDEIALVVVDETALFFWMTLFFHICHG